MNLINLKIGGLKFQFFHKVSWIFILALFLGLKTTNGQEIDQANLESLLFESINSYRTTQNLEPFSQNEILNAVAFDQSSYILKSGKLSHEQDNKKKAKLLDRILFYEGLNAQAGENIAEIGFNSKVEIELGKPKQTADTEDKLVAAVITSWLKESEGLSNLMDPNFRNCGLSVLEKGDKNFVFVLVLASEPYLIPPGEKISFNQHGINPFNKDVCKPLLEKHPTLSQLFSDALYIEQNKIYFQFHNLALFNEIISNSGDGIAIDIIERKQFNCKESNRLFPGEIQNGFLMNPYKKAKLASLNQKAAQNAVKIEMGELPDYFKGKEIELNGLIIKDGNYCETIPYNEIETENVRNLSTPFLYAKSSQIALKSISDTSNFNFPLTDLKSELNVIKDKLLALNYLVYELQFDVKISPINEITQASFIEEIKPIFTQLGLHDNEVKVNFKVDWDSYNAFKKGTYYQIDTEGKSQDEEIKYLKRTAPKDEELKTALNQFNQIDLKLFGTLQLDDSLTFDEKLRMFSFLVSLDKIDLALFYQNKLISSAKTPEQLKKTVLRKEDQVKSKLSIINNQIVAQEAMNQKQFDGNPIHTAFLELYLIDPMNEVLAYNYHLALLNFWAKSNKNVFQIEKWKKSFESLKGKSIPNDAYAKVYLNYQVIAADYYYEKGEFDKRKKAFDELLKWVSPAKLNAQELLLVAKFLCHQDQFPRAVKMLLPEVTQEKVDKDLLYYFLQIAIYDRDQVSEELYLKLIQKAQSDFPDSFCKLFSKEKMGIQNLENQEIKKVYCSHCAK